MRIKLDCHYSGDKSRAFWSRINKLTPESKRDAFYSVGCILQNLEQDVLWQLRLAEKEATK